MADVGAIPANGTMNSGNNGTYTTSRPGLDNHYQIDATGAGSLQIDTKLTNQSAFNTQTTISGESVIIDMINVAQIKLTATSANVPYQITSWSDKN